MNLEIELSANIASDTASGEQNRARATPPFRDQRPFPDVILKSQFFEMVGKRALTSEQRLMLAVLADAINLVRDGYGSTSLRKRASFAEAQNWILQSGIRCPLSFQSVCEALEIDPEGLRSRIGSMLSGNSGMPDARLRLRLKEASRVQRLTVNRVRRRSNRRPRLRGSR